MDVSSEFSRRDRQQHERSSALPCGALAVIMACIALATLSSCEPDPLDVADLKFPATHIVVSSSVLADGSIAVHLSKSLAALEASEDSDPRELVARAAINDADVTLTMGGKTYGLSLLQDGIYKGEGIPLIPGNQYDLRVESSAYGIVTASTILQEAVPFESVTAKLLRDEPSASWIQVNYSLRDPITPNFYLVTLRRPRKEEDLDRLLQPGAYTRAMDDKSFSGRSFSETFTATHKDLHAGDTVEVVLSNVALDYFSYVSLRLENQLELAELFSEPVYYPTNIRGGRGFFSLHISDVRVVVL